MRIQRFGFGDLFRFPFAASRARPGEVTDATEEGTDAHFTATRLRDITRSDCVSLTHQLSEGRPLQAGQVHWHGRTQTRRVASACSGASWQPTAAHFRDHADFTPRWRALPYSCVEHAEFVEQADDVMRRGSHDGGRTRSGTTSPGIRPARVPRL